MLLFRFLGKEEWEREKELKWIYCVFLLTDRFFVVFTRYIV